MTTDGFGWGYPTPAPSPLFRPLNDIGATDVVNAPWWPAMRASADLTRAYRPSGLWQVTAAAVPGIAGPTAMPDDSADTSQGVSRAERAARDGPLGRATATDPNGIQLAAARDDPGSAQHDPTVPASAPGAGTAGVADPSAGGSVLSRLGYGAGSALSQIGDNLAHGLTNVPAAMYDNLLGARQGTQPVVRGMEGKLNYQKLGELNQELTVREEDAPDGIARAAFDGLDGKIHTFDPSQHVLLRDPATGRMTVFARSADNDEPRLVSLARNLVFGMTGGWIPGVVAGGVAAERAIPPALTEAGAAAATAAARELPSATPLLRAQNLAPGEPAPGVAPREAPPLLPAEQPPPAVDAPPPPPPPAGSPSVTAAEPPPPDARAAAPTAQVLDLEAGIRNDPALSALFATGGDLDVAAELLPPGLTRADLARARAAYDALTPDDQAYLQSKYGHMGAPPDAGAPTSVDKRREGPVIYRPIDGATETELAQYRAYVAGSNAALVAGWLSPTGRVSTKGYLRSQADRAADEEQKRARAAGTPYAGVAGHLPDTTWTGRAKPPAWLDLIPRVNSSLGGQVNRYPLGYRPTIFKFEEPGS